MPSPQDKGYFLEFNESFLLAARTVSSGRPLVIEELREASLDNKSAVDQALSAVFPATGATTPNVLCSLRPRNRFFLLATEKDTPKIPSLAAMRALVGNSPFASAGPSELIGVDAHSGLPIDGKSGNRLLLAGAPKESLDGMRATLGEWKIAPSRLVAATVGLLGVISAEQQRAKAGPVLVWEIGESTSDLFLVSAQGLEIVKRLPFGLDRVADGVQAELNLKFRGNQAVLQRILRFLGKRATDHGPGGRFAPAGDRGDRGRRCFTVGAAVHRSGFQAELVHPTDGQIAEPRAMAARCHHLVQRRRPGISWQHAAAKTFPELAGFARRDGRCSTRSGRRRQRLAAGLER
jgi:hypothetical protein